MARQYVAVSAFGDVCIAEDLGGSKPVNDIFCAFDANNDGIAPITRLTTLACVLTRFCD